MLLLCIFVCYYASCVIGEVAIVTVINDESMIYDAIATGCSIVASENLDIPLFMIVDDKDLTENDMNQLRSASSCLESQKTQLQGRVLTFSMLENEGLGSDQVLYVPAGSLVTNRLNVDDLWDKAVEFDDRGSSLSNSPFFFTASNKDIIQGLKNRQYSRKSSVQGIKWFPRDRLWSMRHASDDTSHDMVVFDGDFAVPPSLIDFRKSSHRLHWTYIVWHGLVDRCPCYEQQHDKSRDENTSSITAETRVDAVEGLLQQLTQHVNDLEHRSKAALKSLENTCTRLLQ